MLNFNFECPENSTTNIKFILDRLNIPFRETNKRKFNYIPGELNLYIGSLSEKPWEKGFQGGILLIDSEDYIESAPSRFKLVHSFFNKMEVQLSCIALFKIQSEHLTTLASINNHFETTITEIKSLKGSGKKLLEKKNSQEENLKTIDSIIDSTQRLIKKVETMKEKTITDISFLKGRYCHIK